ncbi:type II 3-dehydroquinate dehydratase [Gordonia zhaorongruii]|uniref:type II 3-dehydroquinate dehydratase n=1 Tax=Gordonia zhaorongruii TaxID=2597659 RepID=UPI00104D3AFE|nr:type II 3-dehydroquinate dehydratase [Gordonia zhaorongruii]
MTSSDSQSTAESPTAELPILLLNGPNLNMLGTRQPEVYGADTLDDAVQVAERAAAALGFGLRAFQTNHEGEMIDAIHAARGEVSGIVINPGGWTHTSVALADALVIPEVPIVEVHVSNVHAREAFRHHSYVSPIAAGVIAGFGLAGYEYAVRRVAALVG